MMLAKERVLVLSWVGDQIEVKTEVHFEEKLVMAWVEQDIALDGTVVHIGKNIEDIGDIENIEDIEDSMEKDIEVEHSGSHIGEDTDWVVDKVVHIGEHIGVVIHTEFEAHIEM